MPELSTSIPVASPSPGPAGQASQSTSHDDVILARHTPMAEPALMDALPSSEPLAPEAEKIEQMQPEDPVPEVPVLSDLVAPFNTPAQAVPAIEYVPTQTLHRPVIAQPAPMPQPQPATPPALPLTPPQPVVAPSVTPRPAPPVSPAIIPNVAPPAVQPAAPPVITIPVGPPVPGPATPPVKARTIAPPPPVRPLDPVEQLPLQQIQVKRPEVPAALAGLENLTPTPTRPEPAVAPVAEPEPVIAPVQAPVPAPVPTAPPPQIAVPAPASISPPTAAVESVQPAPVASIGADDVAPLKIYSHNTQAIWQVRRATRMLYLAATLTVIGLMIVIGIYWVSIGAPTHVKDLPFVQNSVK